MTKLIIAIYSSNKKEEICIEVLRVATTSTYTLYLVLICSVIYHIILFI